MRRFAARQAKNLTTMAEHAALSLQMDLPAATNDQVARWTLIRLANFNLLSKLCEDVYQLAITLWIF
jgi:hypothetical protein